LNVKLILDVLKASIYIFSRILYKAVLIVCSINVGANFMPDIIRLIYRCLNVLRGVVDVWFCIRFQGLCWVCPWHIIWVIQISFRLALARNKMFLAILLSVVCICHGRCIVFYVTRQSIFLFVFSFIILVIKILRRLGVLT